MNRSNLATLLFATSSLAVVAGCTVEERTVVSGPRPPDRVEVVTVRPSPAHVWVHGRWEHRPHGWVWIEGRWVVRG
jgi:hypothetical protein